MTDAARSYACPSCGAAVDEHARRCVYCSAPVATVRCAACFHMNVAEALHCSGCGRETGLEPIGAPADLACPHCHAALVAFEQEGGSLFDCGACGGQFVEHPALKGLVDRRDHPAPVAPPASRRFVAAPGAVKYVPCPACRSLMNRKNFGGTSGVIVDVCRAHGTWFDLGELPRVLAFVESGGLAKERARQLEELAAERRKAAAAAAAASHAHALSDVDVDRGSAFGGFLIDLLRR